MTWRQGRASDAHTQARCHAHGDAVRRIHGSIVIALCGKAECGGGRGSLLPDVLPLALYGRAKLGERNYTER